MDGNQTPHDQPANEGTFQPGVTITPGTVISGDAAGSLPPVQSQVPQTQPVILPEVTTVDATASRPSEDAVSTPPTTPSPSRPVDMPQPLAAPQATPVTAPVQTTYQQPTQTPVAPENATTMPIEGFPTVSPQNLDQSGAIRWTASEFIAHDKTPKWYASLFGVAIVVAALIWLLTHDVISSAVVIVAVGMLASYASRSPRELPYAVDDRAITIGEKQYDYSLFRSFSLIDDGAFSSIEFMPLKRFSPPTTIYYDPKDEDAIAGAIAQHLPFEHRQRDAIDLLIHKIRF